MKFVKTIAFFVATAGLLSCKPRLYNESETRNFNPTAPVVNGKKFCAAIRGNGDLIMNHFSSLARVIELYGIVDGAGGSSSASITTFFYESILKNPKTFECKTGTCDETYYRQRVALMVKSLWGYLEVIGTSPEAKAFLQFGDVVGQIQKQSLEQFIASGNYEKARAAIVEILKIEGGEDLANSEKLSEVINPEVLAFLEPKGRTLAPELKKYRYDQIVSALKDTGKFVAKEKSLFFRPGMVNFGEGKGLGKLAGRVANFYAGYGENSAAIGKFLDNCAAKTAGMPWSEMHVKSPQCVSEIKGLISAYRLSKRSPRSDRLEELIGATLPAMINTAVLDGAAAEKFHQVRNQYYENSDFKNADFNVFKDMKFGYFGAARELDGFKNNVNGNSDLRTKRSIALGQPKWKEVLALSPAEPGLSSLVPFPSNASKISLGGFADLHPTLALKNAGCEKVIYITRQGSDSGYATDVSKLLGMDLKEGGEFDQIYNIKKNSSFSQSVTQSDIVYCTDWDKTGRTDLKKTDEKAWNAPIYSKNGGLDPATAPDGCRPFAN